MTQAASALPDAVAGQAAPIGTDSPRAGRRSPGLIARSLFALTKPRIIELLLVTTLPTMLLAKRGLPSIALIAVTLVGGALAAGSANTINCYIDRDIDAVMRRTSRRPLVASGDRAAAIKPAEALIFGIVLGIAATLMLGLLANWLAAALADAALLFYVFVYTLGLKRRTASNIVIGGAAGCFPVLVGWAAVTGTVAWPAAVLFGVIFFWTPPHFWALAMKFRDDYAAASRADAARRRDTAGRRPQDRGLQLDHGGDHAAARAERRVDLRRRARSVLGGWFLVEAHRMRGRVAAGVSAAPMKLFHLSIGYLTLLFLAVAVSAVLPWGAF